MGVGGGGIMATSASGCYFSVTIDSHLNIHILLESPTFSMVG